MVGRLCLLRMQQRKGPTGMEQAIASLTHTSFWKTNQHQGQNHSCFLYFEDSTPGHLGWEMKRSQRTDAVRQLVVGWIEGWCLSQSLWMNLCVEVGSLNRCLTQNQVIIVSSIQWNYCSSKKNSFEHSCASPWSKDHVKTHGETNQIQVEMRHPRTLEPHRYLDSLLVLESSANQFLWSSYPVCGSPNTLIHKVIHSSVGHYFKTDLTETDLCPTEWDFCGKL